MDKVTIHFNGGTRAVAVVTGEDIEDEVDRLDAARAKFQREQRDVPRGLKHNPDDIDTYVESVIANPPHPHWAWVGDIYLHTGSVAAFDCYGDTTADAA